MEIEKKRRDVNVDSSCNSHNFRLRVINVTRVGPQKLEVLAGHLKQQTDNITEKPQGNSTKLSPETQVNYEPEQIKVLLEGVWSQSRLTKNSTVHLVNPIYDNDSKTYLINNSIGFLVNDPDSLLTCTYVASSLFCERKTWLNHVFQGQVGTNKAMLVGTLVHEVFQYGVKNHVADVDKLVKFLDNLLDDATVMLETYSVEQHIDDIRKEAISYINSIKEWIDKYMFSGPKFSLTNEPDLEVKIIGISDIEENVWSTKYGLKGKIDVTGSVRIYDRKTKTVTDKTIPLELKTGNPNLSASHAAQVSLYSMMIEDRYSETNQGFVIYLKNKAAMHNVALSHNIKRDLIQRRNQINSHMKSYYSGPNMLDQIRVCKNCERLTECILMSDIYSPGKIEEYNSMKSLKQEATGHLDKEFKIFFQKYHEKLVMLMTYDGLTSDSDISKKSFWTYSSEEAECKGTGFGKLTVSELDDKNRLITFKRHPKHKHRDDSIDSQSDSSISSGKPAVVIIDDDGDKEFLTPKTVKRKIEDYFKPYKKMKPACPDDHHQVLNKKLKPFDTQLNFNRCRMAISLDEDEQNMDSQNSSTAIAIGFINELKEDHLVLKIYEGTLDSLIKPDLMYRVDKLEKRPQLDIERLVLVRLLAREDWRCDRVRQLILDTNYRPAQNVEFNLFVLSTGFEEITDLKDYQQKDILEAVSTDNYYILDEKLIKSTTIAQDKWRDEIHKVVSVFARIVTILERTTLIVAQNIDHLVGLMRLLQDKKIKFILIDDGKSTKARYQFPGNLVKVLQNETFSLGKKYEAYIRQHELSPVVITTYAMSIGGLLFTRRTFDYCVAYDCDKTELLNALSPMFCSDRHIIIDIKTNLTQDKNSVNQMRKDDVSLGDHLRMLNR